MANQSKILLTALASALTVSVNAQVTTSALSGKVIDEMNEPVIGATVVAIHEPSGTLYGAVTNLDGRYTIQGMRTGGPYKIEISYVGYKKSAYTGISLELGNTFSLNATLKPSSEVLDEVIVVADSKTNAGASQNFSAARIENAPTVDRNIYDVVKNMPMATTVKNGGITFAGSNNRYNSFQIDGTVSNDVFGLTASGTNGGQSGANPISMDAIQEIQVVIAPFDVRQSGFTGGGINAITKQGTNKFQASAYTYYTNQGMYGKYSAVNDYRKQKLNDQTTKTFGGSLGGAIIKNKLFYFVNAESRSEVYPSSVYPGYTKDYLTPDVAQKIANKYKDYTGIEESYGQHDIEQKSFSLLARIDWNINDKHSLAFRYQHNNSYDDNYSLGGTAYTFNNSGYRMNNKTNSFVTELNSRLSESFYNEFRASATFVRDNRDIDYLAPTVQIEEGGIDINIGTEFSSGSNYLDQDIYTFEDNLSWYKGSHTLTFGTHNEIYRLKNSFLQAAGGSWYFGSVDDFLNDRPNKFTYKYNDPELTGGAIDYAPVIKAGQFGFYAQDKWNVNNNLELTYGLRFDIPLVFNNPTVNPAFNEYAAEQGFSVRSGEMPSAKLMVSPRVGFRWFVDEDHNTLLRGGLGLFTGRVPFVWLTNAFTNTGMEQKGTTINAIKNDDGTINKYAPSLGDYAHDPMAAAQSGSTSKPDIVTVEDDFKYPQVFRVNLAWEQKLPGDVKFTLEGMYSKTLNNVFFENLALTNEGNKVYAVKGVEASSAPYYTNNYSDYYSIINLKNTNEGYTYSLSAMLEKHFNFGLDLSAAYTFGHAKSVNDGTSSVAYSNWKYNYSRDTNSKGELGFSKFDMPHRVTAQVSYTTPKYAHGWLQTNIALVYNAYAGSRYSLTMDEPNADYNNDGWRGNNLLYIPTDAELSKMNFVDKVDKESGKVIMTAAESRQAFKQWIENDNYAKNHRGQYAERNSNLSPWEHQVDLHIGQDIFYLKERGSKLQITFDIINFTNMLNKKWGANYSFTYNVSPVSLAGVQADGNGNQVASYTYNPNNTVRKDDIFSRWHAQIGVKLTF